MFGKSEIEILPSNIPHKTNWKYSIESKIFSFVQFDVSSCQLLVEGTFNKEDFD